HELVRRCDRASGLADETRLDLRPVVAKSLRLLRREERDRRLGCLLDRRRARRLLVAPRRQSPVGRLLDRLTSRPGGCDLGCGQFFLFYGIVHRLASLRTDSDVPTNSAESARESTSASRSCSVVAAPAS